MNASLRLDRVRRLVAWCGGLALMCTLATASWGLEVRTVALSDDTAPDTGGLTFSGFGAPILADFDAVAFIANIDSGNLDGFWSEGVLGTGSLAAVALQSDNTPDLSTTFGSFGGTNIYLNFIGVAAFTNNLDDGTTGFFGQVGAGDSLEQIVRGGDAAPGTNDPNRVFQDSFGNVGGFNTFTDTALRGFMPPTVSPPGNFASSGVFAGAPTLIGKVGEVGDAAPAAGGGTAGIFSQFRIPALSNARGVAFVAERTSGVPTGEGVWRRLDGGSLTLIAVNGESAPGGGTFSILFGDTVAINDVGDVVFTSQLTGGTIPDGVYVARNGGIDKVALEGDVAPDAGGALFRTTSTGIETSTLALDADGNAFFTANLSDNRRGLFGERNGVLEAIAIGKVGSATPGTAAPGTGGQTYQNVLRWAINDHGQVAFLASLTESSNNALFATDLSGNLVYIVGEGDTLEVAPGDLREIEFLNFYGFDGSIGANGNNVSKGLNNQGLIAFQASFLDGTYGVFVTNIPEPATAVFLGVVALSAIISPRASRRSSLR